MKINNPRCDYCGKTAKPTQILRLIWKKKNLKLDLCPNCYRIIFNSHLKGLEISKETLKKSGYNSVTVNDFKHYLEKWAKKVTEML